MTQTASDFRHGLTKILAENRAFLMKIVVGFKEDCCCDGIATLLTQIGTEKGVLMTQIWPDFNSNSEENKTTSYLLDVYRYQEGVSRVTLVKTFQVEEKRGSVRRNPATRIRTSPQTRRTRLESKEFSLEKLCRIPDCAPFVIASANVWVLFTPWRL